MQLCIENVLKKSQNVPKLYEIFNNMHKLIL